MGIVHRFLISFKNKNSRLIKKWVSRLLDDGEKGGLWHKYVLLDIGLVLNQTC